MKTKLIHTMAVPLLIYVLFLLGVVGVSQAATVVLPVTAHSEISDSLGQTRILVDFGDLGSLSGKTILYAKCYLNIDVDTCVDILNELEVKPLTKSWNQATVSWETGWNEAGGDYDDERTRVVDFQRGRNGDTEILLTELVQAWVDEEAPNHGLILIPRMPGCGYGLMTKGGYPGLGYGKLMVRYVNRP